MNSSSPLAKGNAVWMTTYASSYRPHNAMPDANNNNAARRGKDRKKSLGEVVRKNRSTALVNTNQNSVLFSTQTSSSCTQRRRQSSALSSAGLRAAPSATKQVISTFRHMFSQIAKINDHLYLSSLSPVTLDRLRELGITLVITVTAEPPPVRSCDFETVHVPVEDTEFSNLRTYFDRIADRIRAEERRGGKTIVHCMAGVSRSATLVLAYLMKYESMNLREAFRHVRSRRPYISPNIGFWKQLLDYEERIYRCRSVKLIHLGRSVVPDVLSESVTSSTSSTTPSTSSSSTSAGYGFSWTNDKPKKSGFARFF